MKFEAAGTSQLQRQTAGYGIANVWLGNVVNVAKSAG